MLRKVVTAGLAAVVLTLGTLLALPEAGNARAADATATRGVANGGFEADTDPVNQNVSHWVTRGDADAAYTERPGRGGSFALTHRADTDYRADTW